jgi:serine/threonine-protein kinase
MGAVWEARHAPTGTSVAIKILEGDVADAEARRRFEIEARAAGAIRSKHAAKIFEHGTTNEGKPYIAMELLRGESLEARLARVSRLSLQETAVVIGQACAAVQSAHDEGIVHRDLKPDNVFLAREGGREVVKVVDFGIAKMRKRSAVELTASTRSGTVLGTPFYMAPEQARGLRAVDHRADAWSLGVIAYECVVGHLPFDADTVGSLLVAICAAPIPTPSSVSPTVPKAFDGWFARAVTRDPNERFASVTELAAALAQIATTDGTATTQPMVAARRPRKRFAALLLASFVLTFAALVTLHTFLQIR